MINRAEKASTEELAQIAVHVAAAPFAEALLVVDELLWGGFWQGDVIAPGYRLPALELALLRAVRLDGAWPEAVTPAQFLADLRQAILDPQAGLWTLPAAGQPCLVFAAPRKNRESEIENLKSITVVWYCASTGRLHAGYRAAPGEFHLQGAIKQRGLGLSFNLKPAARGKETNWLAQAGQPGELNEPDHPAARLDLAILRIRAGID